MSKVNYLINYLLSERDDLGRIEIPETEQDKFRLYRSLVNIRPAVKADEDFLQAEDEYLTALTESKGITDTSDLTVREFHKTHDIQVIFNVFREDDHEIYKELLGRA